MSKDKDLWRHVTTGLKDKPAYLLVFAICLLFGGGSAYSMLRAADARQQTLGLIGFGMALVGALITVWIVERSAPQPPGPAPNRQEIDRVDDLSMEEVKEENLQMLLASIRDHLSGALAFEHPVFSQAMRRDLTRWNGLSLTWSKGEYRARRDYSVVLLEFYKQAQTSVFSTCLPDYLATWSSAFGTTLLEAHEDGNAEVTRVFVFDTQDSVGPEARKTLQAHLDHRKVRSRVYFDKEDKALNFPPHLSKDFTVIDDGAAVGVTLSFGEGAMEARWQFNRPGTTNPLRDEVLELRNQLLDVSMPLEDWLRKDGTSGGERSARED